MSALDGTRAPGPDAAYLQLCAPEGGGGPRGLWCVGSFVGLSVLVGAFFTVALPMLLPAESGEVCECPWRRMHDAADAGCSCVEVESAAGAGGLGGWSSCLWRCTGAAMGNASAPPACYDGLRPVTCGA